jgi:serpin B
MKPSLAFLLAGCAFFLMQCSDSNPGSVTDTQDTETPFAVAKSASTTRQTATDEALMTEQATSINDFAVDMYQQVGMEQSNFFFSPYSIVTALGMTSAGARGETDRQIREALSVTLEGDDFHAALNGLDLNLENHAEATEGLTLRIVNSSWAQSGWNFRVEYLDKIARYYGAGVNLLNFMTAPDSSRIIINDWVSDQTNDKIKDLLPPGSIDASTRLVLTNAIYYLANWMYTFDKNQTSTEPFHLLDGSTVDAPLMKLGEENKEVKLRYAWNQQYKTRALELPYKGDRLTMTLLLPDKGFFDTFEQALSAELVDEMVAALDTAKLPPVRLPKFTFKSASISLAKAVRALGMIDAFTGAADFSGIDGSRSLAVSDILHKAFIAVDEAGTEAAAATAVVMRETSVIGHTPRFRADRPFIYCIRDKATGVIIFMGKVIDPTKES